VSKIQQIAWTLSGHADAYSPTKPRFILPFFFQRNSRYSVRKQLTEELRFVEYEFAEILYARTSSSEISNCKRCNHAAKKATSADKRLCSAATTKRREKLRSSSKGHDQQVYPENA
jgi:hypothetical protein